MKRSLVTALAGLTLLIASELAADEYGYSLSSLITGPEGFGPARAAGLAISGRYACDPPLRPLNAMSHSPLVLSSR